MSEDKKPIDLISSFDQIEANLINTARVLGSYYKELLGNGIPANLAHDLVMDFHSKTSPTNRYGSVEINGVFKMNSDDKQRKIATARQGGAVLLGLAAWVSLFTEAWLLLLRVIPWDNISWMFLALFFLAAVAAYVSQR